MVAERMVVEEKARDVSWDIEGLAGLEAGMERGRRMRGIRNWRSIETAMVVRGVDPQLLW